MGAPFRGVARSKKVPHVNLFIVSGMPRARTAWVANYMTHRGILCMHEGLSLFDSPEECAEWMRLEAKDRPAVGICDSGAVWFYRALERLLPEAKWALIRRLPGESEASYLGEHGIDVSLHAHAVRLEEVASLRTALTVDFAELDVRMTELARWCVPGWEHDSMRHQMLTRCDVKLTDAALKGGIQRVKESPLLSHVEATIFKAEN